MNALLAFLLVSKGQEGLAQRVTVTIRASRVQVVIDQLAKQSHQKLEVTPAMTPDVVLVSVRDMPLAILMQKIAKVCSAEWTNSSGTWRLGPAAGVRKAEELQEVSERTKWLRTLIDQPDMTGASPMAAAGNSPSTDEEDEMPASIRRFLKGVGPAVLAQIAPGQRIVFSTRPTRMQRSFTFSALPVVESLVAENNKSVETFKKEDLSDEDVQALPRRIAAAEITRLVATIDRHQSAPDYYPRDDYNVALTAYDRAGKTITGSAAYLNVRRDSPKPQDPSTAPERIQLSETSNAYRAFGISLTEALKSEPFAALLPLLLTPAANDPLSFGTTEALLATYATSTRSIVACLSDTCLAISRAPVLAKTSVENFVNSRRYLDRLSDKDATLLRPSFPRSARAYRTNRAALQSYLAEARVNGVRSVAIASKYAVELPYAKMDARIRAYLHLIPGTAAYPNWIVLFGTLAPEQKITLANGGRIPIRDLSTENQRRLLIIVFGINGLPMQGKYPPSDVTAEPDYSAYDATDLLPDGLPEDAFLTSTIREGSFLLAPVDDEKFGLNRIVYAAEIAYKLETGQDRWAELGVPDRKYLTGTLREIDLVLVATPTVYFSSTLMDFHLGSSKARYPLTGLPPEFQKEIEEARRVAREKGED